MRLFEGKVLLTLSFCLLGCVVVLVAFEPLSFIDSVVSFFFGAAVTSGGVQHVWVGVRGMMLLFEKMKSLFSSSLLQSLVSSVIDDSGMGARSGRLPIAFWLGAGRCASFASLVV